MGGGTEEMPATLTKFVRYCVSVKIEFDEGDGDNGGSVRGVWVDGVREKDGDDAHARAPHSTPQVLRITAAGQKYSQTNDLVYLVSSPSMLSS